MEASSDNDILTVRGLTKSYGDLKAVDDLSFSVRRGEVFAFLGPNGAGKTTAISMICGLVKADGGDVRMNGRPSADGGDVRMNGRPSGDGGDVRMGGGPAHNDREGFRHRIGLCPQDIVIWDSLTCLEQLVIVGQLYDLDEREASRRAMELLDRLGLAEKRHALARTLSGGMKRRLNIALALVHGPELVILDEPQAGLDPQSRVLVREYVKSLTRNASATVILTTHDMDEAEKMADRVAIIDRGRLVVLDTPDRLKDNVGDGDILEVRVSGATANVGRLQQSLPGNIRRASFHDGTLRLVGVDIPGVLPQIMGRLRELDLTIEDMTLRKKSLEDVFILLTGRKLRE